MGALKIDCYCDEIQMNNITNQIIEHIIRSDIWSLDDIDQDIEDMRVSVQFDTFMHVVRLKNAEILDTDWDLLYEDSAVLTSRLKNYLKDYNNTNRLSNFQAKQIRQDQTYT